MKRIEFIRSAGRWLMIGLILASGGFLMTSRKISLRHFCADDAPCAGCGLQRLCRPQDETRKK
jgi:hypothetical protein